jgi:hypothetical protein
MYSTRSGLILGFHGCDESVALKVLTGEEFLKKSVNSYDWLGHGIYFWENSPSRAMEFAMHLQKFSSRSKGRIAKPAVIGAVIDLGFCLDLLDFDNLQLLKTSYKVLRLSSSGFVDFPRNKSIGGIGDLLLRELDCAVIETMHTSREDSRQSPFDSIRGVFYEGEELYPNAGFRDKDHIQICVRNPNCIKGFFVPRKLDYDYPKV